MPELSPRDYSKIKKVARLTQGNEGKSRPATPSKYYDSSGRLIRRGSLTQRPRGTFPGDTKTPKGDMKSAKTGKTIDGSKAKGPKEMLTDRQIKSIQGKKPGVLTKIRSKIYALQGRTPRGNPTRNIGPLFKTTSTKGRIPTTRQVRPSTISPVTGRPIKPSGGGGVGRGGVRADFRIGGGGGSEGGIMGRKKGIR